MTSYVFDNKHPASPPRLEALETLFDAQSIENLQAVGVGAGWRCLDVGAGNGSISRWLAAKVGPTGHVTATDIDTQFIGDLGTGNMHVVRHDIAVDELPEAYDLVHTRLLLVIVPERERALNKMLASLKPGGFFVAEEMDALSMAAASSTTGPVKTLKSIIAARQVMMSKGADLQIGLHLADRLGHLGLRHIEAFGRVALWRGGSPGCKLLRANIEQLRHTIVHQERLDDTQIADDLLQLGDPNCLFLSPILWSIRGQLASRP
jgi:SAM-dependent methyltransferase